MRWPREWVEGHSHQTFSNNNHRKREKTEMALHRALNQAPRQKGSLPVTNGINRLVQFYFVVSFNLVYTFLQLCLDAFFFVSICSLKMLLFVVMLRLQVGRVQLCFGFFWQTAAHMVSFHVPTNSILFTMS